MMGLWLGGAETGEELSVSVGQSLAQAQHAEWALSIVAWPRPW